MCRKMYKRMISLFMALIMIVGLIPVSYVVPVSAETTTETDAETTEDDTSVTVYFSASHDDKYMVGESTQEVMALKEIEVPYFDIGNYGLSSFYFKSEEYSSGTQGGGTAETAEGHVTLLHLFIYATEIYWCGLSPDEAGKGYLKNEEILGTDVFTISGTSGSLFMENFWNQDLNLNYYLNYEYPLASGGWGSTADQILLEDGDIVTLGHFTSWSFYTDSNSVFNYVKAGDEVGTKTVKQGENVELTLYRAGADSSGNYTTAHTVIDSQPIVYYTPVNKASINVTSWTKLGAASAEGKVTLSTADMEPGTYLVGMAGQLGVENPEDIVSTPGAIRIVVEEKDPVQEIGYLSELKFTTGSGAASDVYEMTPSFAEGTKEYTVAVPCEKSAFYAWATLSENAPEGSAITAKWVNKNTDADKTQVITSAKATGQSLAGAAKYGNYKNTVTVEVGTGEDIQTYTINIVRSKPLLDSISIADANGNVIHTNETFKDTTTAYTALTAEDTIVVNAVPSVVDGESYTVTYNGSTSNEIALSDGENVISIVVTSEDGYENTYTLTVTKNSKINITFSVTPESALVTLKDKFNERIWPNENGVYELISEAEYSYTVANKGYVGQKNTFSLAESGEIEIVLTEADENTTIDKTIYAQWANFRNGENHLGITDAATPYSPDDAELLWAVKYGTSWSSAPGAPIIVDDCIVTYIGSTIRKLDMNTGAVVQQADMVGSSSYSIVPATYADGIIFVGLSSGRIQAFKADTLESLWVYTDELGGQPNCPITYKDGYIYAGFWNSETRDANFACISVDDENVSETTEAKVATWTYTRAGGFYWAGAYASDKYVVVGSDDGTSGNTAESASLLVFDRLTGKLVDSEDGIRGDIRSNVSYDPSSDRVFFTTKGGLLCNAKVDWKTGEISSVHKTMIVNAAGTEYAMSTCTPSVYNGRIYIGIAGQGQFSDNSGHAIGVYDLAEDGTMTQAYAYAIWGYPQTSAMVTTAYAEEDGSVYIYLPYNATPGGVSVLKDKPGQTEPITTTDSGYSEVFTPQSPLAQYCICSTIADKYGTIYYKNDSLYMMAITSKILGIEVVDYDSITDAEDGTVTAEGLEVTANLKNGLSRDISDYVTLSKDAESGNYVVSYTYGFDSANYGLTTLTAEIEGTDSECKHSETELQNQKDATCTEEGYTGDTVCKICGETIETGTTTSTVDHSWSEWTVVKEATFEETGLQERYCLYNCGEKEEEEIPVREDIPDQDENGVYLIYRVKQLEWFRDKVNGGDTAISAKLMADIDLTGKEWIPIGSSASPFKGSFYGNGFSITNLSINYSSTTTTSPYQGFIAAAEGTSDAALEISNLTLKGVVNLTLPGRGSQAHSAGLCGKATYVNFENVVVDVDITLDNSNTGSSVGSWARLGGLVGMGAYCNFTNCKNLGDINGCEDMAGIVGYATGCNIESCSNSGNFHSTYSNVGGIVGETYQGAATVITKCYNTGDLVSEAVYKQSRIGGILGRGVYGTKVISCYNAGDITGIQYVGGLVGESNSSSDAAHGVAQIHDCYNVGHVTGSAYVGGLLGKYEGSARDYNKNELKNCYNAGIITDDGTGDGTIGTIAGFMHSTGYQVVDNVYYLESDYYIIGKINYDDRESSGVDSKMIEKTSDEMTSDEFVALLGDGFKADSDCQEINNGYPVLTWQLTTDHQYEGTVIKAPTCMLEGEMSYTCSVCGDTYTEAIPEVEHNYQDEVTAPDCTHFGYTTHTCADCGYSYKDDYTNVTEHEYTSEVTKEASCTEEGIMTYTCECGKSYTQTIPMAEHAYEAVVTAPTHDKMGYTTHTCSVCGSSYVSDLTDALEHEYTSEVTKEASCTEEGVMTFTCECGENYTQVIPKTAHSYNAVVTEPTCTTMGYTTYTCSECGDSHVNNLTDAIGHSYEEAVTAPTHDEMGYTTHTCTVCDAAYVDSYTKALDHEYTSAVTKEASCTEEGIMTFTCECGESYTQAIPKAEHSYETTVTVPTCTSAGYTTYTCKGCDHSYISGMREALGHSYEDVVTSATHDAMGYTTHTCKVCDSSYVDSYTAALDHEYTSEVTKEASCTEEGVMTFTCECGESYTQAIPKTDHNCTEETVAAGCETYGYVKNVCQDCDYTCVTDILQPTGHTLVVVNQKDATYSEEGYTGDTVCDVCGEELVKGEVIDVLTPPAAGFIDVAENAWYYDAVNYVAEKGLMDGVGERIFAPEADTTRAMMATLLYRIEGEPDVSGLENPFEDVAEGTWYYEAIVWAANAGVVEGISDTAFAPEVSVTREQMVTMLYRYADVEEETEMSVLNRFADKENVSAYAKEAVAWAIGQGTIDGMEEGGQNVLLPQGMSTRAQIAAVLMRYLEK